MSKVTKGLDSTSPAAANNDLPLTDVETDSETLPQLNSGYDPISPELMSYNLDNAFGRLDEPLTEYESEDEGEVGHSTAKKRRRGRGRNLNHNTRRIRKLATTLVNLAQKKANTIVFNDFDFSKATNEDTTIRNHFQKSLVPPQEGTVWMEENVYRRAMSADGYDLVYHFPSAVTQKNQNMLTTCLINYGTALDVHVKPTADKFHCNQPNSYVQREGEIAGVVHLVRCWHGIGRSDLDMVLSKDFIKSGKAFGHSMQLLQQLQLFSHSINAFLKAIDPTQCASLEAARSKAERKYAYVDIVNKLDPLLMEGRAIMWNRMTPEHKDERDPLVAWAALVVLGHIRSGSLFFRQLNLKLRYQSGDIVWLRGAILDHEVEIWEGEQRICVAHFTHKSYFQDLGLVCLTGPGVVPTDSLPLQPLAEFRKDYPSHPPAKKRSSMKESKSSSSLKDRVKARAPWRRKKPFAPK